MFFCRAVATSIGLCVLSSWAPSADAASIRTAVHEGLDVIIVQGELMFGDEKRFIDAALNKGNALVFVEGPGGNLHAGIEIGKAIRLKGFTTAVAESEMCASACAIAWLGGQKRIAGEKARIGFHAAWKSGPDGRPLAAGMGNAFIGSYLTHLGYSSSVIAYVTAAEPDSMTWLTSAGARQAGLDFVALGQASGSQPRPVEPARQPSPPGSSSLPPIVVRPNNVVDWTVQGEWVQAASRAELTEAISVGQALRIRNSNVGVFRYANGWYGVVIGPFSPTRGKAALEALRDANEVPHDSLVTRGERFVSLEWGNLQPRIASAAAQLEAQGLALARRFYATWSADNDTAMAFLRSSYDPQVTYFGKAVQSDVVLKEKGRFAERWAARRYVTREDTLSASCDLGAKECTIRGIVDWDATNPGRAIRSTGAASFELAIRFAPEGPRVFAEKSDVLTRERASLSTNAP